MSSPSVSVKDFAHVRAKPGPKGRFLARAAEEIGVSLPHLSLVWRGKRRSPAVSAALAEWMRINGVNIVPPTD